MIARMLVLRDRLLLGFAQAGGAPARTRESRSMGMPQVPEEVRGAPMLMLRAVFAGIGRIVMSAERQATTAPGTQAMGDDADGAPALPLASYDSLSLASIRARLRGLDAGQLKVLLEYEAANAERADVLGMFERRIEKLEAGG